MPSKFTPSYGQGRGWGNNREFRDCNAVTKEGGRRKKCRNKDALPYFTSKLTDIRSTGPKSQRNVQPKWRCDEHKPKKVVSPTNGKVYTIQEYEAKRSFG